MRAYATGQRSISLFWLAWKEKRVFRPGVLVRTGVTAEGRFDCMTFESQPVFANRNCWNEDVQLQDLQLKGHHLGGLLLEDFHLRHHAQKM